MSYLGLVGLFGLIGLTGLLNKVHPSQSGGSNSIIGPARFLGLAGFWFPYLGACGAFGALGYGIIKILQLPGWLFLGGWE